MIKIRYGCFETNSSSVHSLIIVNEEEYKQLLNGELFLDYCGNSISKDEAIESLLNYITDEPQGEEWVREFCENEMELDNVQVTKEWFAALPIDKLSAILTEFCDGIKSYEDYMEDEYLESYCEDCGGEHCDCPQLHDDGSSPAFWKEKLTKRMEGLK